MNPVIHSVTRRKYVLVGSAPASMRVTVSEQMPEFILQENRVKFLLPKQGLGLLINSQVSFGVDSVTV